MNIKRIIRTVSAVSLLAVAAAGCKAPSAAFSYGDNTVGMLSFKADTTLQKTVIVLPAEDKRDAKHTDPLQKKLSQSQPQGEHGSFGLGILPLLPSGFRQMEKPEQGDSFVSLRHYQLDIADDYGRAVFENIKQSNLFANVKYSKTADAVAANYAWRSKVTNTYYTGNVYSYLITYILASPLWVLGAPYGTSENELWIEFELVDLKRKEVVWKYSFRGRSYKFHWIYSRKGKDVSMYAQLLKKAVNEALGDLSRTSATLYGVRSQ